MAWHEALKGSAATDIQAILSAAERTLLKARGEYIDACKKRLGEAMRVQSGGVCVSGSDSVFCV